MTKILAGIIFYYNFTQRQKYHFFMIRPKIGGYTFDFYKKKLIKGKAKKFRNLFLMCLYLNVQTDG